MMAPVTAASLLVDALRDAGVQYIFANFGSDHPAIIEALAADRERGRTTPAVVLCPHEYSALTAAHGYAAATGQPQAVFVHTDVGTANLGGAVHNAARSRIPVFILAGLTPYTLEGELAGSRNTHINHLQDAPDQHALVRQYVKWSYDVRTGRNLPQIVHRGLQLAASAPAGPVYVTAAREVLAESVPAPELEPRPWRAIARIPAPDAIVDEMAARLAAARRPVLVTSYLGRRPEAVPKLVEVAERFGLGVVEPHAEVLSFPRDHELHLGDDAHAAIADADVVVALETDVPWLLAASRPRPDAAVYVVNEDPLQESIPLWYLSGDRFVRADGETVLDQLLRRAPADAGAVRERATGIAARSAGIRDAWADGVRREVEAGELTAASVAHVLATLIDDDTIVVNEAISEAPAVWKQLPRQRPGTLFSNRGTSLGWSGGGALGIKLADRARTVVSLVGDGTFFFSAPASTYWIADRYRLPVLTVVLDNGGWNATKRNLRLQHGDGRAVQHDRYWVNLQQSSDFAGIAAAAGGAWGATVEAFDDLAPALLEGLRQVAELGRPAVVTVRLAAISAQPVDEL